ncbi:MAG: hypothetical protein AB7K36_03895 [Chloroflexota bacterium]
MKRKGQLQVEVYAHGGWWKDDLGRTGQVEQAHTSKGPLVTVAALANGFGIDGWQLTNLVSARHNTYVATFERATDTEPQDEGQAHAPGASASINLG